MAGRISRPLFSAYALSAVLVLGWSPTVGAQSDASATREQQAAQLRVAVEARMAALDEEYTSRAQQLRDQFNARRQELEETTESEFVLSNAMAPISRVYQDSLAALQREINARKDSAYAAQSQANNELNRQGMITPETWSRISSTPLDEYPLVALSTTPAPSAEPAVVQEAAPAMDDGLAGEEPAVVTAPSPRPSGCEVGWYPDGDRDLFGDAGMSATLACYQDKPAGFVDNNYDCDDADATINPITGHCATQQR